MWYSNYMNMLAGYGKQRIKLEWPNVTEFINLHA